MLLEGGQKIEDAIIAFSTWGVLNKNRSNAMKMIKSRIYEAELQKRKDNENIKNKDVTKKFKNNFFT